MNQQNARTRGSEYPHETKEMFCDSEKVTLWCALLIDLVTGSYYFDDQLVTGDSCLHLLISYLLPMLAELPANYFFSKMEFLLIIPEQCQTYWM